MKIHKESSNILINQILIFLSIGIITTFNVYFLSIITPLFFLIFLLTLYFFRIPKRTFEKQENCIYAPCDGKIVIINEAEEQEYYKDKRIQISIFMSPLNVHNQRYCINGNVIHTKYHPGKYLVAWHPKSSLYNERSSIVIKNKNISVLSRQIAGAVARRIITYSKLGDIAKVSDEYGFIKFGSRVDLFLPLDTKIKLSVGDKVKAGQSIIANY